MQLCGPGCLLTGDDVPRKPGSAGKGFLYIDARVVDTEDKDVPPNTPGELILRGKNVMAGYKVPKTVKFIDALPVTPTGKVRKMILKKQVNPN